MDISLFYKKKDLCKKKKIIIPNKIKKNDEYNILINNLLSKKKIDPIQHNFLLEFYKKKGSLTKINKFINIMNNIIFKDKNLILIKKIFSQFSLKISNKKLLFKIKYIINSSINDNNINYTENQKSALKKLLKFLYNTEQTYSLNGYAGTGKTTLIVELAYFLIDNSYINSIAFTAPTNKAVNIIKAKFSNKIKQLIKNKIPDMYNTEFSFEDNLRLINKLGYNIQFMTIHRLLNFKNDYDMSGSLIFVKGMSSKINSYDLIIIDESSMISMQMISYIFEDINNNKILFVGDPAQLPPVNEKNSMIFGKNNNDFDLQKYYEYMKHDNYDENGFYTEEIDKKKLKKKFDKIKNKIINQGSYTLKKIIRTNMNNILGLSNEIRSWVLDKIQTPIIKKYTGESLYVFKKNKNLSKCKWINKYINNILKKNNDVNNIILAWTNKQCNTYNNFIRKKIFNNTCINKYNIGELLILNDFYNISENDNESTFYTSEQIKVLSICKIIKATSVFHIKLRKSTKSIKCIIPIEKKLKDLINLINKHTTRKYFTWKMSVSKIKNNLINKKIDQTYNIYVIMDKSILIYKKDKEFVMNKIKLFRKYLYNTYKENINQLDKIIIKPLWEQFNKIFIEPFANVNYGYCTTIHKSQGSTYEYVYIDIDDITDNNKLNEMKRCLYTACTRGAYELNLLI
jgi:hypothetical protein